MTYTDKFISFYKNTRSAFTGNLYEELEEEDILKLYIMEYLFREYYQIEVCEDKELPKKI
jgi:hypothetical protein